MTNNTDNMNTIASTSTWQLNALTEALGDLTLTIDDSLSIGRGSDNDVVLGSKQVSRNHAVLSVLDGQLYVKDLDSSNGTFINEQRIEGNQSSLLQVDDTIGFASFSFQVEAPVAAQVASSAPVATEDLVVNDEIDTESADAETAVKEDEFEEYIIERPAIDEPVVKETGINEVLSAAENAESAPVEDTPEPIVEEVVLEDSVITEEPVITETVAEPQEVATMEPESPVTDEGEPLVEQPVATERAVYEEAVDQKTVDEAAVDEQPVVESEHDKTTKTTLQEEADPDVLRAKQAATAQFSGTTDLGQSHDLGTEGNNAKDQEVTNPANTGQPEKKPSGGWFIWVFIVIVIVALALWFFNTGTV